MFKRQFGFVIPLLLCSSAWAQSTGHIGHGGGSGDQACIKAKVSRQTPENMTQVSPGSEFSFFASGSNGPNHIHVQIKNQTIPLSVEDKETFYLVKGKLPEDIKNTVVRISVSLKAKFSKCDAESGWLLKVGE
ncbi:MULTISPECIES: hypothetical protein [Methylomonas]|uniref:hypothetical protein n=1 Tax=Methylomonas TaxID=416 RepID=UPI001232EE8B|nr:hypothetical protein [Methylomonas rhizoryzae]